ncbi:MAG: aminotransferase class I/II-fold pyridoxal phosphate-dependent enzyme [Bacillota bacterium]|nr:aminotransferase class I/II-fold pyridoxal phosphate-dependent enzyme [Bacillota bacterium]
MLNRKQYDKDIVSAKKLQIEELKERLSEVFDVNTNIHNQNITVAPDEDLLEEIMNIEIPRAGRDAKDVADELVNKVFKTSLLTQHPRFFSFVASGVSPYSIAGSILSDIYNINNCGYETAPPISLIEEKLIRWMGSRAGFGDECGGVFTSGGSLSNLTGMIAARCKKLTEDEYSIGTAYISDQTHSSVKKGFRLMGIKTANVSVIPSDDAFKMRVDLLEEAIKKDLADGKKPFLVVGTLGTTNTGSIDPLDKISEIAKKYEMWMHVDGAFGGSVLFSDIYCHLAKGIEEADSLSWDTHKWAMQVYSCSCIIAKDKKDLINAFMEHPEYLEDVINSEHTDSWDLGIEMSRPARAIKLWYTVQAMGTDLLADVIDYPFFHSSLVKKELEKLEGWEITSPPMCGTITFRFAPKGLSEKEMDDLNGAISRKIIEDNYAYIVTTTIKGKRALRMNMINCNSTDEDIISTVRKLDEIAHELV